MSDDVLVRVEGVSKKFCRSLKKSLWYGMQDLGNELRGRRHGGDGELRPDEFWAVKDVSFELRRGECLGLIGRNGAGKTTLLRMLNGLIKPDRGRIEMRGRVGALIALGAGFNPVLTGRENIYVNASILGLSRQEVEKTIDEIIEFSQLNDFIDMPVQSYSSGMTVRLGFSIASTLNPDILLLDEVLAVGDMAFRVKCFDRIGQLLKNSAVIFVSHDAVQVSRICDRCVLLKNGTAILTGSTIDVMAKYEEGIRSTVQKCNIVTNNNIVDFRVEPKGVAILAGETFALRVLVKSITPASCGLALIAFYENGSAVAQAEVTGSLQKEGKIAESTDINIGPLNLRSGQYDLCITILDKSKKATLVHAINVANVHVTGSRGYGVPYQVSVVNRGVSL